MKPGLSTTACSMLAFPRAWSRSCARIAAWLGIALLSTASIAAHAVETNIVSSAGLNYSHTVWTLGDGAPTPVEFMAQTPDGWIWLGSESGLYRFDGLAFERSDMFPDVPGTRNLVSSLFVSREGDLWIGYVGISVLRSSRDPEHPHLVDGVPAGTTVDHFVEDGDGGMWAVIANTFYRLDHDHWRKAGSAWGLSGAEVLDAVTDRDGILWAATNRGIHELRRGQSHFDLVDAKATDACDFLGLTASGQLWCENRKVTVLLQLPGTPKAGPLQIPIDNFSRSTLFDEHGGVWITSCPGSGLCRAAHADAASLGAKRRNPGPSQSGLAPMSSGRAISMLEDRQGIVWIGTPSGLERFRRVPFSRVNLPQGYFNYAMAPDDAGGIWLGNAAGTHDDAIWAHLGPQGDVITHMPEGIYGLYRDTDGSLLMQTKGGEFRRFARGRFTTLFSSQAWITDDVQAIVRDGTGHLWIAVRAAPIFRFDKGRWVAKGGIKSLPDAGLQRAVVDARKRLWLGYINGLYILDGDEVHAYSKADGLDVVDISAIVTDGTPLVGGENGLAAFDGTRFHRIVAKDENALHGISGMLRLADGTLWLNGTRGAVRIAAHDLQRAIADPGYKVPLRMYDASDGYPGTAQEYRPLPTLVEGTDGRLWFAGTDGLAWLDPAAIKNNTTPPNVIIRAITVDGHDVEPSSLKSLAPGTRNLEIDYTALLLGDAERARFRYRLDGVDHDWQAAGSRRQAFYTNLGPGTYQFHVTAANEDGLWNQEGAKLTFSIEPTFFQTNGFVAACAVAAILLLWMAYLLHLRQVTSRLQQRLEERHHERARIARELHDTFLQAVQSLIFKVHAVSRGLPQGQTRESLDRALDVADSVVIEGRERVHQLREITQDRPDLRSLLAAVRQEIHGEGSPDLYMATLGTPRTLSPLVIDELYSTAREALLNAFNHARAQKISVTVCYERNGLCIRICDDGRGIDPGVLATGGRSRHWGLQGMHERMERIGGKLEVASQHEQAGTRVTLYVPSSRAYGDRSFLPWLRAAFFSR